MFQRCAQIDNKEYVNEKKKKKSCFPFVKVTIFPWKSPLPTAYVTHRLIDTQEQNTEVLFD